METHAAEAGAATPANVEARLEITLSGDRSIIMTRTFDAPRALVFEAFTNPEHVPHWFGPRGWTLPVCEIDLRPGGAWRYIMRGPDGSEMRMKGVYQEVAPPERLVSTEIMDDYEEFGASMNTMTLAERDGRTTMTTIVEYPSQETRDAMLATGMESGAGETYDRLAEHIVTM